MRLQPTEQTIKRLFALSGNRCAFPNCTETLVQSNGICIAEICHIEAANEGGGRFNQAQTDEGRRAFENLVLFCRNHHGLTNDTKTYTVDILQEYKQKHEKKFINNTYAVSDEVVRQTLENYSLYINTGVKAHKLFQGGVHNHYGSENGDIGIVANIVEYIFKNTTVDSNVEKQNLQLTTLRDKLILNFSGEHLQTMKEMMSNLWTHKELVASFVRQVEAYDSLKINGLVDKIQSDYRILKNSPTHNCEITDVNLIQQLAINYLPPDKKHNPEYVVVSKAIILYFFELCDLGKRATEEQAKQTLFD